MEMCKDKSIPNQFNLPFFKSKITARSAKFTKFVTTKQNRKLLIKEFDNLNPKDFLLFKVQVGSKDYAMKVSVLIHKNHANLGLMLVKNFWKSDHKLFETNIWSLDNPLHPKRQVHVDPKERCTLIFGIDYYGELKMSVLRMAMEICRKDRNGIGLHAGSKLYVLRQGQRGVLVFGLSGTGKTTLCCHRHENTLKSDENTIVFQDDINFINPDGIAYGAEKGFYVKCDQCPEHQSLTKAVKTKGTIIENVGTDLHGNIDWKNFEHTRNTRAVISRESLDGGNNGGNIDLGKVDVVIFNTRRPEVPPIGKLMSHWQKSAFYALGESVITSAEDPTRAGEAKRQIGFDPFIIDNPAININRFAEIVKNNNIEAYVVNTGYIGNEENNITVDMTLNCIEQMLRGNIEWKLDKDAGYLIPKTVPNFENYQSFEPRNYYGPAKYTKLMDKLRKERKKYLKNIKGIDDRVAVFV
jgi:phosphoenolpyruvate carboxykinase (ATP)